MTAGIKWESMSEWITPKVEDIDITEDGKEVHILFESNSFGSRYISIEGETLELLKKMLSKIYS